MAASLVDSMTGDYDADEFDDDYRDAVVALLEAKVSGGDVSDLPAVRETASGGEVVDLLAALQRSVDAARSGRGEAADTTTAKPAAKAAPKKAAAKKAPAKKGAAKATTKKATKATKAAPKKAARRSA
jgi:DNA end-binding protein Ku